MKPIPAIVEKAIDVDLIAEQAIVAIREMRAAEKTAARHDEQASNARAVARERRLTIGRMLLKARGAWPARGVAPDGKDNWIDFLAKIGLADSTARMYMDEAKDPAAFAEKRKDQRKDIDSDDDTGPRVTPDPDAPPGAAPFRQLSESELVQALARLDPEAKKRILRSGAANVKGGSGEDDRGKWCTSKSWAEAVGPWDLDPFSNPRSLIASVRRCMLEDGGDAFGGGKPGETPGLYLTGNAHGLAPISAVADAETRVFIQPPFELVTQAIMHYGHTRFCALLRWSPDVKAWFALLWPRVAVVCHPLGERMEFNPPPGVDKSGDMPFPHALYYADERDVTDAVRARCIVHVTNHPKLIAPSEPALHLVR